MGVAHATKHHYQRTTPKKSVYKAAMTSDPNPKTPAKMSSNGDTPPTPLRCVIGAGVSGSLATALYFLTRSIVETFANKPVSLTNQLAAKVGIAVRTLVMGLSTLATTLFAIATLGLLALAIQLWIQNRRSPQPDE